MVQLDIVKKNWQRVVDTVAFSLNSILETVEELSQSDLEPHHVVAAVL